MRVSKVSLCPPEPEAGGRGGVLVTLWANGLSHCHDEVVIGSPSWVVARSLDCVVCGRGQARASHTHCHYKSSGGEQGGER